ncbi:large subunit GTPase 1 homolog isoform X1 [Chiloscyllium plagiosum]|uniref:large subunit GTPase 1 homolog isoform X1 n=1 Tax=Chiloscyllium plagiosum TaxID=36176 RepID=UPI001CB7F6A7|nr:large subunit GTPase 1 homolog isoform X1 [Chiloscyllium plagiosum]
MGKKKSSSIGGGGLGRAIIKEKNQSSGRLRKTDSWLHTSELNDGYNWGRLNLQSVTEQSTLDEFLATAELAGTEFVAEKLNVKIISAEDRTGLLTTEESKKIKKIQEENKQFLSIPRRPYWDENTAAEELQQSERENFLEWRRQLARLEEERNLILTPFERNLEFWRQLWRVIERSDIVVQIVDARNPLLFRCEDLERYVKEVQKDKDNMILLNKSDLLTCEQRKAWARYFDKEGIQIVFWSATAEGKRLDAEAKGEAQERQSEVSEREGSRGSVTPFDARDGLWPAYDADEGDSSECEDYEDDSWQTCSGEENKNIIDSDIENPTGPININPTSAGHCEHYYKGNDKPTCSSSSSTTAFTKKCVNNPSHLMQRNELLKIFRTLHEGQRVKDDEITVGLVGYPNVGKSSTINTILQNKKVSVSATPGHTKHFQTLYVEPGLCLCDCPGLVMPSFVSTKAEMVCSGILPIDQMRDHVPPISLVCQHIPRHVLEATYGINIIRPREDEDPNRQPTYEELLTAYGYMRGFMTAHGQPDQPRAARYILKDYVTGKLLYCHSPPGIDPTHFQFQHAKLEECGVVCDENGTNFKRKQHNLKRIENYVDKSFFHQENMRALTKGIQSAMGLKYGISSTPMTGASMENVAGKPWKKHGNRHKKEKLRRMYKHLDG